MVLTGGTEVLGEKHYIVWVVGEWMGVEHWWNGTDTGKLKYWERNIIQRGWQVNEWVWSIGGMVLTRENTSTEGKKPLECHFVYHKLHKDQLGKELGPPL